MLEPDTDLSKRCMRDIHGTIATKRSLTTLLMNAVEYHLQKQNIAYFIAGNGDTRSSFTGVGATNHKEGETAIIMDLSTLDLLEA